MGTTTIPHMSRILDDIDAVIGEGKHCLRPLSGRDRSHRHGRRMLADAPRARRRRPDRTDRGAAPRRLGCVDALAGDLGAASHGDNVEARALSALVDAVLPRAWRRESEWHGEHHWRCVAATGLTLGTALDGVDRGLVFCFGLLHDTRRENETYDPGHGTRAASFAAEPPRRREVGARRDAVWHPRRGTTAALRRPGVGRSNDRRLLGRGPAASPASVHRARPRSVLDGRRTWIGASFGRGRSPRARTARLGGARRVCRGGLTRRRLDAGFPGDVAVVWRGGDAALAGRPDWDASDTRFDRACGLDATCGRRYPSVLARGCGCALGRVESRAAWSHQRVRSPAARRGGLEDGASWQVAARGGSDAFAAGRRKWRPVRQ